MTDILDRLRLTNADFLHEEAANEIERLRDERDMWRNENAKKTAACEQMGARITELEAERDELQDSFNLRWKADMRAIRKWQAANQGNDLVWPDHTDLVVWLLAERDRMRDALLQIASSGVNGESLNLSRVGHAGCINVAKDALKENDQ